VGHRKLKKFAEVEGFSNVFQTHLFPEDGNVFPFKGNWKADYFKNNNPITLELGCGRGEYTVELARRFPNHNFIGMDIKGARLWKGAKAALTEGLKNVAFVRNRIDFIETYFAASEISEIWIPFPDPYPGKAQKRLVAPPFIERYRRIAPAGTIIHLKTDNHDLYEYALEQVKENNYPLMCYSADVYSDTERLGAERFALLTEIQTYYEKLFLSTGSKTHYAEFSI
jgi:tRNA (guanine-N7-)-methyltransferase